MIRRKFNKEMFSWLQKYGKRYTARELRDLVLIKFNESFTLLEMQKYLWKHNIDHKYESPKKVHCNNGLPIGSERMKSDGMCQVKISDKKWEYKQRLIYEKYHNIDLPTDTMVIFLDGNKNNYDINNLMAVKTREYNCARNKGIISNDTEVTRTAILVSRLYYKMKGKQI